MVWTIIAANMVRLSFLTGGEILSGLPPEIRGSESRGSKTSHMGAPPPEIRRTRPGSPARPQSDRHTARTCG
jgi:hypothetical protein